VSDQEHPDHRLPAQPDPLSDPGHGERSARTDADADAGEPTQPIPGWTPPTQAPAAAAPATSAVDRSVPPAASPFGPPPAGAPTDSSAPNPPTRQGPAPLSPIPQQSWGPGGTAPSSSERPFGGFFAGEPATAPMPVQPPDGRRRVSRWTWPAVAFLALVVGLLGGFLGALGFDRLDDDNGRFEGGLDAVQTRDSAPLDADNGSVPAVAQALLPSTVQIIAAFDGEDGGATGSGFVLDRQGHIVTNNHVVASAAEDDGTIRVVDSEGTRHDATVVGRSPVYDLAILQVDEVEGLVPAALGASTVLNVGDPVVAFGSPLGLSQTVTSGIVSALNRPVTTGDSDNESSYINAVQTDAAINPGNSGGPLVNLAGEVVGVNSAIATTGGSLTGESSGNIGVGFAIPIEQVRTTADQILATGEARYPVIGAQVRTGGGDSQGALITQVNDGTPAQDAGLLEDDVVTRVDGAPVTDGIALIVAIRTHQPGDTIEFTVRRDGEERTVEVTLDGEVG
jgi:putative serine protease PepD